MAEDTSILGRLIDPKDPASQMALIQMGLSLLGPQTPNQSVGTGAARALGQGINFLTRTEQQRAKAAQEQQRLNAATQLQGAQSRNLDKDTATADRKLDQVDRQNQIKAYDSLTERGKAEMVYRAALAKAKATNKDGKNDVLIELIKGDNVRLAQGLESDPLGIISTYNAMTQLVDKGLTYDNVVYDPATGDYGIQTHITGSVTEEGAPVPAVIRTKNAAAVRAAGFDPDAIKANAIARDKAQKAKGVGKILEELGTPETLPESATTPTPSESSIVDTVKETAEKRIPGFTEEDILKELLADPDLETGGTLEDRLTNALMRELRTRYLTEDAARRKARQMLRPIEGIDPESSGA
jgi:hypothetical protein